MAANHLDDPAQGGQAVFVGDTPTPSYGRRSVGPSRDDSAWRQIGVQSAQEFVFHSTLEVGDRLTA
jgi:hypothetical protein